ncbi:siderophore-interacting protein [Streptomyces sp. NPDC050803]|uniref:siderophore-interacting protein n=1 Tax=unclassified Streptomyces TaxID=2593676 RepID=UPI0034358829
MAQGHGWQGTVLKLMGAKDYVLTVTGAEDVSPDYRRVHLTDGGMLAATGVHPTMWVRLWFDNGGKPHQRAYTLVDPDPAAGTFSFEFALHEGCASDWARAAKPGDTIEATVQGTGFQHPQPAPSHVFAIGGPASLPALNSLLEAVGSAPTTVWFEGTLDGLPFHGNPSEVRAVPRHNLVDTVRTDLPDLLKSTEHPYVWIACDTATTRTLAAYTRRELGVPKERMHALGYWRAT